MAISSPSLNRIRAVFSSKSRSSTGSYDGRPASTLGKEDSELTDALSAWRAALKHSAEDSKRMFTTVDDRLNTLKMRAQTGDAVAMESLVKAAETGPDLHDAASKRAGDFLFDLMSDPGLPQEARQSLTTCAETLITSHDVTLRDEERDKRIEDHVPLELVNLVAASPSPVAEHAGEVIQATRWLLVDDPSERLCHPHRMVSSEELKNGAQSIGVTLGADWRVIRGEEASDSSHFRGDGGHFWLKLQCMHEGKKTFLTVDPAVPSTVDRHRGVEPQSLVYGRAQNNTPNSCGPICLLVLKYLKDKKTLLPENGDGAALSAELPTLEALKKGVTEYFTKWNSYDRDGQTWAVSGARGRMLAASPVDETLAARPVDETLAARQEDEEPSSVGSEKTPDFLRGTVSGSSASSSFETHRRNLSSVYAAPRSDNARHAPEIERRNPAENLAPRDVAADATSGPGVFDAAEVVLSKSPKPVQHALKAVNNLLKDTEHLKALAPQQLMLISTALVRALGSKNLSDPSELKQLREATHAFAKEQFDPRQHSDLDPGVVLCALRALRVLASTGGPGAVVAFASFNGPHARAGSELGKQGTLGQGSANLADPKRLADFLAAADLLDPGREQSIPEITRDATKTVKRTTPREFWYEVSQAGVVKTSDIPHQAEEERVQETDVRPEVYSAKDYEGDRNNYKAALEQRKSAPRITVETRGHRNDADKEVRSPQKKEIQNATGSTEANATDPKHINSKGTREEILIRSYSKAYDELDSHKKSIINRIIDAEHSGRAPGHPNANKTANTPKPMAGDTLRPLAPRQEIHKAQKYLGLIGDNKLSLTPAEQSRADEDWVAITKNKELVATLEERLDAHTRRHEASAGPSILKLTPNYSFERFENPENLHAAKRHLDLTDDRMIKNRIPAIAFLSLSRPPGENSSEVERGAVGLVRNGLADDSKGSPLDLANKRIGKLATYVRRLSQGGIFTRKGLLNRFHHKNPLEALVKLDVVDRDENVRRSMRATKNSAQQMASIYGSLYEHFESISEVEKLAYMKASSAEQISIETDTPYNKVLFGHWAKRDISTQQVDTKIEYEEQDAMVAELKNMPNLGMAIKRYITRVDGTNEFDPVYLQKTGRDLVAYLGNAIKTVEDIKTQSGMSKLSPLQRMANGVVTILAHHKKDGIEPPGKRPEGLIASEETLQAARKALGDLETALRGVRTKEGAGAIDPERPRAMEARAKTPHQFETEQGRLDDPIAFFASKVRTFELGSELKLSNGRAREAVITASLSPACGEIFVGTRGKWGGGGAKGSSRSSTRSEGVYLRIPRNGEAGGPAGQDGDDVVARRMSEMLLVIDTEIKRKNEDELVPKLVARFPELSVSFVDGKGAETEVVPLSGRVDVGTRDEQGGRTKVTMRSAASQETTIVQQDGVHSPYSSQVQKTPYFSKFRTYAGKAMSGLVDFEMERPRRVALTKVRVDGRNNQTEEQALQGERAEVAASLESRLANIKPAPDKTYTVISELRPKHRAALDQYLAFRNVAGKGPEFEGAVEALDERYKAIAEDRDSFRPKEAYQSTKRTDETTGGWRVVVEWFRRTKRESTVVNVIA